MLLPQDLSERGEEFVGLVGQICKSSLYNEDRVFGVLSVTDGETVLGYTKKLWDNKGDVN